MKKFVIPAHYRSSLTGKIKEIRSRNDPRKQDFLPTILDFGPVTFYLARHFGFCYGVENAIEISYKALEENPSKRVFLLSQMIHNPEVNNDLQERGIEFIMDTDGTQFIPWDEVSPEDVVIVPAFGTTLEVEQILERKGIETKQYNTTCPFVERVWNKADKLGKDDYTVVVHGKPRHEETRATFSHSARSGPSVIVRNMKEAQALSNYILESKTNAEFYEEFEGRYTQGFDPDVHLKRVGVVNQTTMLATETQAIADFFRQVMLQHFGEENLKEHFADTRDTLCYATNDNQQATYKLLETDADLAIVVGGYNSSNTSHIVELCEQKFSTYFIDSEEAIISKKELQHFNFRTKEMGITHNYIPDTEKLKIALTSGASCPDTLVDEVMLKLLQFFPSANSVNKVLGMLES